MSEDGCLSIVVNLLSSFLSYTSFILSQIGEEVYHVTGELELEGGATFLHCSVNGVKSRPKLVILDNTVHLFSMVCVPPTSVHSTHTQAECSVNINTTKHKFTQV